MKKVTRSYDKRLRELLTQDAEFRELEILPHAHALSDYAIHMVTLRRFIKPTFPILSPLRIQPLSTELMAVFQEAYQRTHRIAVDFFAGAADAAVGFHVVFLPSGNSAAPLITFFGGSDSQAARRLEVTIFDQLKSAEHFTTKQRQESFLHKFGP